MQRLDALSRLNENAAQFQALASDILAKISCRPVVAVVAVASACGLAGCAQQQQFAHGKEFFPTAIYGKASPRVVDNGPIPHGGGTYKVGEPYTIAGKTYYPNNYKRYSGVGLASWYGDAFHGRRTANGEIYDRNSISAAHPTMPLPSYARVTNLRNHYSIIVRVNDRGPFARGRIMDVSRRVAELLDFRRTGTAKVKVDYVGPASLAGSNDRKLAATLREDGRLAQLDMRHPPTYNPDGHPIMTASAENIPVQTSSEDAGLDETTGSLSLTKASFTGPMPLPPARPFDLGARSASNGHARAHQRLARR